MVRQAVQPFANTGKAEEETSCTAHCPAGCKLAAQLRNSLSQLHGDAQTNMRRILLRKCFRLVASVALELACKPATEMIPAGPLPSRDATRTKTTKLTERPQFRGTPM